MSFWDTLLGRHYEKHVKEHEDILKFSEIVVPFGALRNDNVLRKFYREGLFCFLLGQPNASMMIMVSCLERVLKMKYAEIEGKNPKLRLINLLDWLKEKQGDLGISDIDIPHGFRMLRNYVAHELKVTSESDAIEGIKYVSRLMNELYDYEEISKDYECGNCEEVTNFTIPKEDLVLGEEMFLYCESCDEDPELVGSSEKYKIIDLL